MISEVTFITETYLRENTPLINNVDAKHLRMVYMAQDAHIQPILGTTFYNQLLDGYSAQTLTADEITLVEYIQPALAFRALTMMLPFMTWNLSNKGPQSQFGDNSAQVTQAEVSYLKNETKNMAEFYETRLTQYLCKNGNLYSGYTASANNSTDVIPNHKSTGYDSGIGLYPNGNCTNWYNGFNRFFY